MNIILFGPPGSGKGTQSAELVKSLGMRQVSTGDLFREAIKNKTAVGVRAKEYMDKGNLVPDGIVLEMVEENLSKSATNFILDGFPRNLEQAAALDALLNRMNISIDKAIFLEVDKKDLIRRLVGRRVCSQCGNVYHVDYKPCRKDSTCDSCGGAVVQRTDDTEEVVVSRLGVYEQYTSPLRDYYKRVGKYNEVNGNRSPHDVFEDIKKLM